jgi:3'-5' exonuclease
MELLRGFWSMVEREKPRIVTWNGRGFDMAVLVQRAFVHGVPMRRWHQSGDRWNSYGYRYALDWNCDLMDALGEHGAASKLSLQDTAAAVGPSGQDRRAWQRGRADDH